MRFPRCSIVIRRSQGLRRCSERSRYTPRILIERLDLQSPNAFDANGFTALHRASY
jgi:hypothetical protein